MEDTNGGLLNWMKSPEGQGLLATVFGGLAGAQRGQPLNSLGRAGMSGLAGYGGALDRQTLLAEKQKEGLYQNAQIANLNSEVANRNKPAAPAFNQDAGGYVEPPSTEYPNGRFYSTPGLTPKPPPATPNIDPAILAREKFEWDKKNPGASSDSQRGQIIFDAQGNAFNVNPYTNEVRPVAMSGKQIQGAQYSPSLQGSISGSKASGKETGQAAGESAAKLQDMESMMPRLEGVTSELSALGKKATYTMAGQGANIVRRQIGMGVGEGAVARTEYISKVDNEILPLLRQTFGAQFTQKEGESLKATLGNANVSPEEKDAILKSFIETKYGQIAGLKRRTGQQTSPEAKTPVKTGMYGGKKVIQYSDGSTEYAN